MQVYGDKPELFVKLGLCYAVWEEHFIPSPMKCSVPYAVFIFSTWYSFILDLNTHFLHGFSNEALRIFQKIYCVSDSLFTLLT